MTLRFLQSAEMIVIAENYHNAESRNGRGITSRDLKEEEAEKVPGKRYKGNEINN
jgi:hypothetical protein